MMRITMAVLLTFMMPALGMGMMEARGEDAPASFAFESALDILLEGQPWARTVTTPYRHDRHEETYKVFTHLMDFDGTAPLTKGVGGKFSHHRGLFLGWRETVLDGRITLDTWHMENCSQRHTQWIATQSTDQMAEAVEQVDWCDVNDIPILREVRTLRVRPGDNGLRVFDFMSQLRSDLYDVELKGDLHHAGMQIRLANEVSEHEDTTEYILPAGAEEGEKDAVTGAWWVGCNADIGGKRYGFLHMTPPHHPTGMPVYSIRDYGRFGAFFEATLEKKKPLEVRFRIVLSPEPLDREACENLYQQYAGK